MIGEPIHNVATLVEVPFFEPRFGLEQSVVAFVPVQAGFERFK